MHDMFKEQSGILKEQGEMLKELLNRVKNKTKKEEEKNTGKLPGLQLLGL